MTFHLKGTFIVIQRMYFCAKAKRWQRMFYLCESGASATNVLSMRKRSVSNECFICAKAECWQRMFYLCESEASATNVFIAKYTQYFEFSHLLVRLIIDIIR
ncbi:hypothetical protein LAV73_13750 [Lysinibacillus xylanilyticus]|uniref:hypothetical protein n=1 Tax=Lysinibacillus xylanilyticus TaxID=582475 RepID=UPI002B250B54|nr:hypothetical protein [Lysinibacillus xylanilyticus]MEB2281057.1 hypothetical protein [Lysinibacillus xylanilyticus]